MLHRKYLTKELSNMFIDTIRTILSLPTMAWNKSCHLLVLLFMPELPDTAHKLLDDYLWLERNMFRAANMARRADLLRAFQGWAEDCPSMDVAYYNRHGIQYPEPSALTNVVVRQREERKKQSAIERKKQSAMAA